MFTIFSCPKDFKNNINIIQRNAIGSWMSLEPRPEILLMGDSEGTDEVTQELSLRHILGVEQNQYGTPLVSSIFKQAQKVAYFDILCYINADIVLTSDFIKVVQFVTERKKKFLLIGRRYDVEIEELLNFGDPGWEKALKSHVLKQGILHAPTGIDYFVFTRGVFYDIPPFALGRTIWDGWLVYRARALGVPVIDATKTIWAIHQKHGYSQAGKDNIWKGEEARHNLELSKWCFRNISNATYRLNAGKLQKRLVYLFFEPLFIFKKTLVRKIKHGFSRIWDRYPISKSSVF